MLEWEEGDRMSFDDSDRFEEDSLCSWGSEPESLCYNWRGWKKPTLGAIPINPLPQLASHQRRGEDGNPLSLAELCSRVVAAHIAFEVVEQAWLPVPEPLQLRVAFWSFPDNEEDIRLYSCLANGSADEFQKGEHLYKAKAVKDALQIGFHLSASVVPPQTLAQGKGSIYNVAVTFDRRRITSCNCTCASRAFWCAHVVAVCLYRIHQAQSVTLRAPVSESLSRLQRDQLQKFAQYLISELPQQILPTAQRLLDELLSAQPSAINSVCGAPDPTAGASANEQTSWCLDESTLHENIHKILIKFCVPSPTVFSDVNCLSSSAPPAAAEWSSLLRPLRGREPEGMWNLMSIVREMFKRHDRNAIPLLEVLTEECMSCEQIMVWWFNTKVALHNGNAGSQGNGIKSTNLGSQSQASQYACSSLCDEVVILWRLAALNPGLSSEERELLHQQFSEWHVKVIDKVTKSKTMPPAAVGGGNGAGPATPRRASQSLKAEIDIFTGFKPAIEACYLNWEDYTIPGVTYTSEHRAYHCPFTCFRHSENHAKVDLGQVNSSSAVLTFETNPSAQLRLRRPPSENDDVGENSPARGGNRSSVSSEGFCENDTEEAAAARPGLARQDSDDPAVSSDANDAEASTDKEKSSQEDGDSDWSGEAQPGTSRQNSEAGAVAAVAVSDAVAGPSASSRPASCGRVGELKPLSDPLEILFARAEGLHAHGHSSEACDLGVQLATELLANPPDLMVEIPPIITKNGKKKKTNPACHQISCLASATLAKCAFLCTLLSENPHYYHLAFRVAMFGLELPRPPATTKPLEVKLAHQESELVNLLKRISLGPAELAILREKAEQLRDGILRSRGEALLPLSLATFIFEALSASSGVMMANCRYPFYVNPHLPGDEILGFEAAVAALGLKANVSEADHPLLCEGTRRQRGDLAIMLLVHYKDEPEKLAKIMEKLLDREVHPWFKAPLLGSFYTNNPAPMAAAANVATRHGSRSRGLEAGIASMVLENPTNQGVSTPGGANGNSATERSPSWDEEFGNWEALHHPTGAEGVADANANRTPQSHRAARHHGPGPGSDTGSSGSGKSSGSEAAAPQGGAAAYEERPPPTPAAAQVSGGVAPKPQAAASHPPHMMPDLSAMNAAAAASVQARNSLALSMVCGKANRFKGKRLYPSVPNQPSEASAHFMFELAKTVLTKAGGNSSTSLFTQPMNSQNPRGPHRTLHMCAFQIGLYALGLHNCVSPKWLSRTYSSHVSWITGQAMEIGAPALWFLISTWEGHLTPPEVASIADRASRGHEPNMERAAAELALSCLPHAHALNPNEIQRAILQCKEQSSEMLERACLAVESAAKGGGVYPEVLFGVARHWYELYEQRTPNQRRGTRQTPPISQAPPLQTQPGLAGVGVSVPYPMASIVPFPLAYGLFSGPAPGPAPSPAMPVYLPAPGTANANPNATFSFAPPIPGLQYFPSVTMPLGPTAPPPNASSCPTPMLPLTVAPPTTGSRPPLPMGSQVAQIPLLHNPPLYPPPPPQAAGIRSPPGAPPSSETGQPLSPAQLHFLLAAYRVGIVALETLGRRAHDDRPQARYSRNPQYGEDVKWLLSVAKKLGTEYLQQFCMMTINSVVSPFVLHEIAVETAHFLSYNGTAPVTPYMQHLRSRVLAPLIQKCQTMYIQCVNHKLYHLTPQEYDDFLSIVQSARSAFHMTPTGPMQFNDFLQSIQKSKSCTKELWNRILSTTRQPTV